MYILFYCNYRPNHPMYKIFFLSFFFCQLFFPHFHNILITLNAEYPTEFNWFNNRVGIWFVDLCRDYCMQVINVLAHVVINRYLIVIAASGASFMLANFLNGMYIVLQNFRRPLHWRPRKYSFSYTSSFFICSISVRFVQNLNIHNLIL